MWLIFDKSVKQKKPVVGERYESSESKKDAYQAAKEEAGEHEKELKKRRPGAVRSRVKF